MIYSSLGYKFTAASLRQSQLHSSLEVKTEKRGVIVKEENVSKVYNNYVDKNVKTTGNLIPTEFRFVFWSLLTDQLKWNKVFDKLIERIDELEEQPIEVKEIVKH
jgi:adenosine deaminase